MLFRSAQSETLIARTVALAKETQLPVVATHPVQFMQPDEFKAHEARVCIAQGQVLGDQRRIRLFTEDQYFKSTAEMQALFADLPQALSNAVEIARRCNLEIELGTTRLPAFPTPEGVSVEAHLESESAQGLARRLTQLYPQEAERATAEPRYAARLVFEIQTIVQMGFAGY